MYSVIRSLFRYVLFAAGDECDSSLVTPTSNVRTLKQSNTSPWEHLHHKVPQYNSGNLNNKDNDRFTSKISKKFATPNLQEIQISCRCWKLLTSNYLVRKRR
ncbi:uncharacterized protein [Montipora capricornis]|uniref:uncharacterized protein isoform X2 n=1 Tax=Montipora capricornis TaxID=246305 RepID=UPI0035F12382